MPARGLSAPDILLDPDGEGLYLRAERGTSVLREAASHLHGDRRLWREVDAVHVRMAPVPEATDDGWRVCRPRWWWGFLPRRPGVGYVYCTPRPE